MFSIQSCPIPDDSLLHAYEVQDAYADCYTVVIYSAVSHAQFVAAFYTTFVFKVERAILKFAVSRPSTDAQAEQLAAGAIDAFAAWQVEKRGENQLLMTDFRGHTRSWLMVRQVKTNSGTATRLYFGSAVVPLKNPRTGQSEMGRIFRALLGFHKIYSRVLLHAAKSRLNAQRT